MNLFDIVGPVMVGPSSSHTAGAVKIGYVARKLLAEDIVSARIQLYGSFLATGKGHGTGFAIVGGLLGMKPDDERIPHSLEIAKEKGITISFGEAKLSDGHPNTAVLMITGTSGKTLELIGESVGGSMINIAKIDGLNANFSGDSPTLIIHNEDTPGHVANVTGILAGANINIATLKLYRGIRGGQAVMVIEIDDEVSEETLAIIKSSKGIKKVTYYSPEGN